MAPPSFVSARIQDLPSVHVNKKRGWGEGGLKRDYDGKHLLWL